MNNAEATHRDVWEAKNKAELNKRLCGLLGIPWHEVKNYEMIRDHRVISPPICSCGAIFFSDISLEMHIKSDNPDFTSGAGKVQLMREMEKHQDGKLFFAGLIYSGDHIEAIDDDGLISRDYLTDDTSKEARERLAKAAVEFLKGRKG